MLADAALGPWLLLAQTQPEPREFPLWGWIVMGVAVLGMLFALNLSGSRVRSAIREPWQKLADDTNCDLNMGFFLSLPIVAGKYRGIPIKAWMSGNLLIKTFKTHLDVSLPEEVPYHLYLFGSHVNDNLGTLYSLQDLSKEIPDFTGQLLYRNISEPAAMSLANATVMNVLTAHPNGALRVSGDTISFETGAVLVDAHATLELVRWLMEMAKYVVKLR